MEEIMKVLIIDDVKTNILIFQAYAKSIENINIFSFTNPVEAYNWCKENMPDIIITDYMMPEMDGIEFSIKFRELYKNDPIPIIMITAFDEKDIKLKALNSGINDFLPKPVDKVEFIARVKNMLTLREAQKKIANKAKWLQDEVRKATKEIRRREYEIITRLSRAAEFRDTETGNHIIRMARYSRHIAKNLGLSEEEQDKILTASPMHDVGKIAIPDRILLKPGKLTDEEFEIMKTHTVLGAEILQDSGIELLDVSMIIALTHHEKYNGKGYPKGLKGEEIPIYGRICAVADVFDALTSERPYKSAWSVEDALKLINEEKGEHFDPKCVEAFLKDFDYVLKIKERFAN